MSQYIKISSLTGGSCNCNLKSVITYIGKHYGRLANKEGRKNEEYFEGGVKFIIKHCGRSKEAVRRMIEPKKIKNSKSREWCFNKRFYGKSYAYIVKLLYKKMHHKSKPSDKAYVEELLNKLYQDVCSSLSANNKPDRLYSNALIFWQKDMLELHRINNKVSEDNNKETGKIITEITEVDNKYQFPSDNKSTNTKGV